MRRKASNFVLENMAFLEVALRRLLNTTCNLSFRLRCEGSVSRHETDAVKMGKVNVI